VTSTGNITTAGTNADGIKAEVGAGSGTLTVTSVGNITTTGAGADGILASSLGSGPITITVKSGTVSGGSGTGAGVFISGGSNNTLTNLGTLTALSGLAIEGNTGNNTVNNFGTVIGDVTLGSGTNAFNNMAGGLFDAGATVNLGAGNTLTNAGTLSPGGAGVIETTALTGNLVQTSTGRLLTDINIGGATSDLVNVSGTASLAGAVQLQIENAKLGPWQQTVLSAAGGTTDNGLTLIASPVLQAQLVFPNATDVVVKSAGINFLTPGLNTNQISLANTLNAAAPTANLGGPVFNVLFNGVTSLAGYGNALTQLDGEDATGAETGAFQLMNAFLGLMLDPSGYGAGSGGSGGALGFAPDQDASLPPDIALAYAGLLKAPPQQTFAQRWTAWGTGFGGSASSNGDPTIGSNNVTTSTYGYAAGLDYHYSPDTVLGFSLAGGGTNWNLAQGLGTGRSDALLAGVHGVTHAGPWYLAGALAFANNWFTTNRSAFGDALTASFQGQSYSGRLEGGYRFALPMDRNAIGVTPYAAIQAQNFQTPAYSETDLTGGGFGLSYNAMNGTDTRSELGSRFDDLTTLDNLPLILRAKVAWAHDWVSSPALNASFETLPGSSFTVNGAPIPHDSALTSAGAQLFFTPNWSLTGKFDGEFASGYALYAGTGTLRYTW
jgi:uncharacterized protein with beta-barrel porin domain